MTRDDMIRATHRNASSWQVLVGVYAVIVAAMLLSASAII